jgi:hypothetical protein
MVKRHLSYCASNIIIEVSLVPAGKRQRALRHVLFQAALAAACHNPILKPVAQRLKARGKPHKLVIVAIANAILKTGTTWRTNPIA